MNKTYRTVRDHLPARIICTDFKWDGEPSIIIVVTHESHSERIVYLTKDFLLHSSMNKEPYIEECKEELSCIPKDRILLTNNPQRNKQHDYK
jgi:hypothetical protein